MPKREGISERDRSGEEERQPKGGCIIDTMWHIVKLRFCGLVDPSSNLGFTTNSYMSVQYFYHSVPQCCIIPIIHKMEIVIILTT